MIKTAPLTVADVAELLSLTPGRVRQLLTDDPDRRDRLRGTKVGQRWLISRREAERFGRLERRPGNPTFQ